MKIKFRDKFIDMRPVLIETNNGFLKYKYEFGAYAITIRYKNDTDVRLLITTPFDEIEDCHTLSFETIRISDILKTALNVISDDIDWRIEKTVCYQQILDSIKTYM